MSTSDKQPPGTEDEKMFKFKMCPNLKSSENEGIKQEYQELLN